LPILYKEGAVRCWTMHMLEPKNTCTGAGIPCSLRNVGIGTFSPIPPCEPRVNRLGLSNFGQRWIDTERWERTELVALTSHPIVTCLFVCVRTLARTRVSASLHIGVHVEALLRWRFSISVAPHPPHQLLSPEHVFLALQKNLSSEPTSVLLTHSPVGAQGTAPG
jgi:hypothetical protein